jgi:hypothetical protein
MQNSLYEHVTHRPMQGMPQVGLTKKWKTCVYKINGQKSLWARDPQTNARHATSWFDQKVEKLCVQNKRTKVWFETNRISANGYPTLCTSEVVLGRLPRAIPVSEIPRIHTERKQIEYNIHLLHQSEYISSAHGRYKSNRTESSRKKTSSSGSMQARETPYPQVARA